MTEAARNHTKWVCFLDTGAAALREKAEEEWNRRFPQSPGSAHNPQPIPNTKRKRKRQKSNACQMSIAMHVKHIDQLSLPQAR